MAISRTHRDSDGYSFFLDAWGQAIVTGALTLIPTRRYPRWLRHALIWGFPAAGAVAVGYFAAKPQHLAKLGERFGAGFQPTGESAGAQPALAGQGAVTGQDAVAKAGAESGQSAVTEQGAVAKAGASQPLPPGKNVLMAAAVGLPIAAAFSGVLAGAFWADEKIERGLRRARVPAPRVVMGVAAAAMTWYQVTSENKRSTPERSAPA